MILGEVEDLERIDVGVDAALDPTGGGRDDVLLAPAEEVELVLPIPKVPLALAAGDEVVAEALNELADGGALDDGLPDLTGDELRGAELVELAEALAVSGQQALGDQLQEDRVVALECGEDLGVVLELAKAVLGQVAGAAARLPARLDRRRRVPGGGRFEPGGARLELAARLLLVEVAAEDPVDPQA